MSDESPKTPSSDSDDQHGVADAKAKETGAFGQPVTIGILLLVVGVAVFRVVIWPMIQDRLGYGVGCKVLSGELVCRLQAITSRHIKYCWKMKLRCEGQSAPLSLPSCRMVRRDQNLELQFAPEQLKKAGCNKPISVEVSEVKRERLTL